MKLFVTDTCPRCVPIKRLANESVEIINLTNRDDLIEQYGVTSVPTLLDGIELITDVREIIKKVSK